MKTLKKVWISPAHAGDWMVLSLESAVVEPRHERLSVDDIVYPVEPPTAEKHHVIMLRFLDADDLLAIREAIDNYLDVPRTYDI